MAAADAFKPQGQELSVVGGVNPAGAELGRHVRTQGQPLQAGPAPRAVKQGGERFQSATGEVQMGATAPAPAPAPAAAPPVPSAPQARGQFQPAPQAESIQQQLGAQQPPPPRPVPPPQPAPAALGAVETFEFYIDGVAPDGTPLTSGPFLGSFPAGSRLDGAYRHIRVRG